ncbi:terminase small subunit [Clostridium perfringens]|nr:terminase small subunit [Clostridium perfringens]MCX0394445.1 terminase small subunit [Clostridium perfringens]
MQTCNATDSVVNAGYSKNIARVIGQENLPKPADERTRK